LGHHSMGPLKRLMAPLFVWALKLAMLPFRPLSRATLRQADSILTSSDDAKRHLSTFVDAHKIHTLVCGVNINIRDHEWPQKPIFEIVTTGYFIRRKNIAAMIETFDQVQQRVPNVTLRLVGEGPERPQLERLVKEKKLETKVIFEGKIPHQEVEKYYYAADIYCSTSLSETDIAPGCIEAMASGLPVAVMETDGFKPLVQHGVTGFMVPQGDQAALVETICTLLKDKDLRKRIGQNAQRLVQDRHHWPNIGKQFYDLYREVLNT